MRPQGQACASTDSPFRGDRNWLLLGVWNVNAADVLTVVLYDPTYTPNCGDRLVVGDAMMYAIWPTVDISQANVTVNPKVPSANAAAYADWVTATAPMQIPEEGQQDRLQFQVTASIDPLYYSIQTSTPNDWQAILPSVSGLEYWTAAWGGTRLTAVDNAGDLVVQTLSSQTGQAFFTVYSSIDPSGPLAGGNPPTDVYAEADIVGSLNESLATETAGALTPDAAPQADDFAEVSGLAGPLAARVLTPVQQNALMANAAYGGTKYAIPGWAPIQFSNPNGVEAKLFYNGAANKYVLAYKGTTPTSYKNLIEDSQSFYSVNEDVNRAIDLAITLAGKYHNNLSFTGHSLGGGLAAMAAIQTGLNAITFNAMAVSPAQYNAHDWLETKTYNNIESYYIPGEALTNFYANYNKGVPPYKQQLRAGRQIALPFPTGYSTSGGPVNSLKLHLMGAVLTSLGLPTEN